MPQSRDMSFTAVLDGMWTNHYILGVGVVTQVTVRMRERDVLIIIKVKTDAGPKVGFAGAADLKRAIHKANGMIYRGEGTWRDDNYT